MTEVDRPRPTANAPRIGADFLGIEVQPALTAPAR